MFWQLDSSTQPILTDAKLTKSIWDLSGVVVKSVDILGSFAVDLANLATQLSGSAQLVDVGTILETSPQQFSYKSTPTDRLRLVKLSGEKLDVAISQLSGHFSDGGKLFMDKSHTVNLHVKSNELADLMNLKVRSQLDRGNYVQTLQGSFKEAGIFWDEISAQKNGSIFYDPSYGWVVYKHNYTFQSTLLSKELDVNATVNESYKYDFISGDGDTIYSVDRQASYSWVANGSTYELRDLRLRYSIINGRPTSHADTFWLFQGKFFKDGVQIGQVQRENITEKLLQVSLFIGNEKIVLLSLN